METKKLPFVPVVVGAEIGGYYWSRSFHKEYGIKPYVIGKTPFGFTAHSTIIEESVIIGNFNEEDVFMKSLIELAERLQKKYPNTPLLLVETVDSYTRMLVRNADTLSKYYTFNAPSLEMFKQVSRKKELYELAEKHDMPYPKTWFHQLGEDLPTDIDVFPLVVKASDKVEYFKHPFQGQEKVFVCFNQRELETIVRKITESGNRGQLILQEYLKGDDTDLWDSVVYINSRGKAQFVSFGQVALQEPQEIKVGNYTAVLSRFDKPFMERIVTFLETIGYTGFVNVDMKRSHRDGEVKILEMNTRTGRSSYYVEMMGESLAKNLVDDLIHNKDRECHYVYEPNLFTVVPSYVLKSKVKDPEIKKEIKALYKEGKVNNPLVYKQDRSFKRKLFLAARDINYIRKYRYGTWNNKVESKKIISDQGTK